MRKVAPAIENCIELPILHIESEIEKAIARASYMHVGLLGTRYTMGYDFYRSRLVEEFGLDVIVPNDAEDTVRSIIYAQLCNGVVREESQQAYIDIIRV